jgi:hypothetical protein
MNETNEPGFLQDWNFIHVRNSNIIYDLTTGIEYAYAENGEKAALYIWQVGSKSLRSAPVYEDDIAREFWRQLVARVVM